MTRKHFLALSLLAGGLAFGAGSAASWLLSQSDSDSGGDHSPVAELHPELVPVVLDEPIDSSSPPRTIHSAAFQFRQESIPIDSALQGRFDTKYRIHEVFRYTVSIGNSLTYRVGVSRYRDSDGATHRAIIHLPDGGVGSSVMSGSDPNLFRREAWNDLSRSVARHTSEKAMFIGWWDNMQRLHLHTGRRGRPRYPDADGYPRPERRALWKSIAGGWLQDQSLSCLSRQLLTDVDEALAGIVDCAWQDEAGPTYLLVSTDDLSHVQEMSYLAGRGVPLETRRFSSEGDIHGVVASVNSWARQLPCPPCSRIRSASLEGDEQDIREFPAGPSAAVQLFARTRSAARRKAGLPVGGGCVPQHLRARRRRTTIRRDSQRYRLGRVIPDRA